MPDTDNTHSHAYLRSQIAFTITSHLSPVAKLEAIDALFQAETDRLLHEVIEQKKHYTAFTEMGRPDFSKSEEAVPLSVLNTYLRGGNHDDSA